MNYGKIIELLQEAEKELLSYIDVTKLGGDYDQMQECLNWARAIRELSSSMVGDNEPLSELSKASVAQGTVLYEHADASSLPIAESRLTSSDDSLVSDGFPYFFFFQDRLFKIGQSRNNPKELYKKSMPIEDARLISGVVEKLLSERSVISVSDVLQELSNRIPVYKVNLTLGGLVKVGAVIAHGRGSYILNSEHEGGSNDWMCEIEHYPKRSDLLDEISNSNKMR